MPILGADGESVVAVVYAESWHGEMRFDSWEARCFREQVAAHLRVR